MTENTADSPSEKPLLRVLKGEALSPPPVWLMRQAGRYLPEYRKTRKEAGSFLDLCYNPPLAAEVTLQPIRRYGFDGAILFSDILVIPDALGQPLWFVEGEGPRLEPLDKDLFEKLNAGRVHGHLEPVYETVRRVKAELPASTAFLGFCGAPWTVATYMVAGKGTTDQGPARRLAASDPVFFGELIDLLVEVSSAYLIRQLKEGVDAVQIFDTWAGILGPDDFMRWCVKPVRKMVELIRKEVPDALIIGFPKGAGARSGMFCQETGVNAIGLDWTVDPQAVLAGLPDTVAVQGNLDPVRLVSGGKGLDEAIDGVLKAFAGRPHIFNLGHGITPDVPVENVERLIRRIRGER